MGYTTSDLLTSVKARAMVPADQETLTDADILRMADEELNAHIVPLIREVNQEYGIHRKDYTIVSGQTFYRLPPYAHGGTVEKVSIVDSGGVETDLEEISSADAAENAANCFYLEDNYIVPLFTSAVSGSTLRVKYFRKPGTLVQTTAVTQITSVSGDSSPPSATGLTMNATTVTLASASTADLIRATPGFETVAADAVLTRTGAGPYAYTFTSPSSISLRSNPEAGDYLCAQGTSPIPQIPIAFQPLLYARTEKAIYEALGDLEQVSRIDKTIDRLEKDVLKTAHTRVNVGTKKIKSTTLLGR